MPIVAPPPVPQGVDPKIADYLRRFSTWAHQEMQQAILKDEATAHLILAAYDVKSNPKIFQVVVSNAGALLANPVPLGGGKP